MVAGAVLDRQGRVLIAQRPAGKHLSGRWEFPGGKVAAGETDAGALARELREELGIDVLEQEPFMSLVHEYPDRCIDLRLHLVRRIGGEPRSLDGQRLKWVRLEALGAEDLLEADRPFVEALQRIGAAAR